MKSWKGATEQAMGLTVFWLQWLLWKPLWLEPCKVHLPVSLLLLALLSFVPAFCAFRGGQRLSKDPGSLQEQWSWAAPRWISYGFGSPICKPFLFLVFFPQELSWLMRLHLCKVNHCLLLALMLGMWFRALLGLNEICPLTCAVIFFRPKASKRSQLLKLKLEV